MAKNIIILTGFRSASMRGQTGFLITSKERADSKIFTKPSGEMKTVLK
jgi:hypothetical protein